MKDSSQYKFLQPLFEEKKLRGDPGKYLNVLDKGFTSPNFPNADQTFINKRQELGNFFSNVLAKDKRFQGINLSDESFLDKVQAIKNYKPYYTTYNKQNPEQLDNWLNTQRQNTTEKFGDSGDKLLEQLFIHKVTPNKISIPKNDGEYTRIINGLPDPDSLIKEVFDNDKFAKEYKITPEFIDQAGLYRKPTQDMNLNLASRINPAHSYLHEATHALDHLGSSNDSFRSFLLGKNFLQDIHPFSLDTDKKNQYKQLVESISTMIGDPQLAKRNDGAPPPEIIAHMVPQLFNEWQSPKSVNEDSIDNQSRRLAKRLLNDTYQNFRTNFHLPENGAIDSAFLQKLNQLRGQSNSPKPNDRINLQSKSPHTNPQFTGSGFGQQSFVSQQPNTSSNLFGTTSQEPTNINPFGANINQQSLSSIFGQPNILSSNLTQLPQTELAQMRNRLAEKRRQQLRQDLILARRIRGGQNQFAKGGHITSRNRLPTNIDADVIDFIEANKRRCSQTTMPNIHHDAVKRGFKIAASDPKEINRLLELTTNGTSKEFNDYLLSIGSTNNCNKKSRNILDKFLEQLESPKYPKPKNKSEKIADDLGDAMNFGW